MPDLSLSYDADLWSFVDASYDLTPTLVVGDLRVVLTEKNGITYAAFPGTRPDHLEDWLTDFAAVPHLSVDHPEIGHCHAGVIEAVEAAFQQFADAVANVRRLMGGGHSLGGGFALGMAALICKRCTPFERLTTFGGIRVGMSDFRGCMAPIPGRRYRIGDDPVPELAPWPYLNDRAWTRAGEPAFNPLDDHAIKAYGRALDFLVAA